MVGIVPLVAIGVRSEDISEDSYHERPGLRQI